MSNMARGRSSSAAVLLLLFFCALLPLLHNAVAVQHVVGGAKGWTNVDITDTFYDEWAANQTFKVNDTLLFMYAAQTHNVWVVTVDDLATCNTANSVEKYDNPDAPIELYRDGDFAFVCQVAGHCTQGMKMKVTVAAPPPAPPLAPGEAPLPDMESPPAPPPGDAPDGSLPEIQEPPSDTTPPPSAASSLQSLLGLAVGGLFACLTATLIL